MLGVPCEGICVAVAPRVVVGVRAVSVVVGEDAVKAGEMLVVGAPVTEVVEGVKALVGELRKVGSDGGMDTALAVEGADSKMDEGETSLWPGSVLGRGEDGTVRPGGDVTVRVMTVDRRADSGLPVVVTVCVSDSVAVGVVAVFVCVVAAVDSPAVWAALVVARAKDPEVQELLTDEKGEIELVVSTGE